MNLAYSTIPGPPPGVRLLNKPGGLPGHWTPIRPGTKGRIPTGGPIGTRAWPPTGLPPTWTPIQPGNRNARVPVSQPTHMGAVRQPDHMTPINHPGTQPGGVPPGGAAGAPAAVPKPAGPSPLDSTYFLNTGAENAKIGQQIAGVNEQSGYGRTDLQNALSQLSQARPQQTLQAQEAANRQGLLYSGHLGNTLGQLDQSYADKVAGLNTTFGRAEAARGSQIAGLEGDQRFYNAGQYLAAVQRAALAAQNNPAAAGAANPPAIPGAPGAKPVTIPKPNRRSTNPITRAAQGAHLLF